MRQPLVAGNWKMNGSREMTAELLESLARGLEDGSAAEVLVCPPFVYLADAQRAVRGTGMKLGSQSVCAEEKGAFTGEVAAEMLLDFDCEYVIVGHSERRSVYGEDNALVARKFMAALKAGLKPIVCVGETLEQRESGDTDTVIAEQIAAVLDAAGVSAFANAVIAYEPVWAIGTGKTASPEEAQAVHKNIRDIIASEDATIAGSLRILYGGSVKASNAAELFAMPDIDGGLIGGASLEAEQFLSIAQAAG
ncbi:MAG: triose-phosphate isomerase [Gammaproteobacteria bacterium]|nr:triose-phosphate isomerase [Gammaproteobacteria bacterium]